jgi:hypothetical protein
MPIKVLMHLDACLGIATTMRIRQQLQTLLGETDGIVCRHNAEILKAKEVCCVQRLLQRTVGAALLRGSHRKLCIEARHIARQDLIGLLQRPCLSQA